MKPYVILHMMTSLDGRIIPDRWSSSPNGDAGQWFETYMDMERSYAGQARLIGSTTVAELNSAAAHPPAAFAPPSRPHHFANRGAPFHTVTLDRSGNLHFEGNSYAESPLLVLLGKEVADEHLAELAADGVSYVVSETDEIDIGAFLETLNRELGIERLLLEGGGTINGVLFKAGLVDEVNLLVCPVVDGGKTIAGFADFEKPDGPAKLSMRSTETLPNGAVRLLYTVS